MYLRIAHYTWNTARSAMSPRQRGGNYCCVFNTQQFPCKHEGVKSTSEILPILTDGTEKADGRHGLQQCTKKRSENFDKYEHKHEAFNIKGVNSCVATPPICRDWKIHVRILKAQITMIFLTSVSWTLLSNFEKVYATIIILYCWGGCTWKFCTQGDFVMCGYISYLLA